jgi:hypothetical protein
MKSLRPITMLWLAPLLLGVAAVVGLATAMPELRTLHGVFIAFAAGVGTGFLFFSPGWTSLTDMKANKITGANAGEAHVSCPGRRAGPPASLSCGGNMMARYALTLLMTFCVAVLVSGCTTSGTRLSEQHAGDSKRTDPILVLGPGYTMADVTNRFVGALPARINSSMFAPYDSDFISVIQQHWVGMLDAASGLAPKKGQVAVSFLLYSDGHVSNFRVVRTTMDESVTLICQKAVLECAPFAPWPPEMKQVINNDSHEIQITFDFEP